MQTIPKDIIGMDISKDKIDIYFLYDDRHLIIDNSEQAIKKFINGLEKDKERLVAMEFTGGYELKARKLLNQYSIPCHVAHPKKVYHFSQQKGYIAKTDKLDAKIIAQYAQQESVKNTPIPSEQDRLLRELSSRRSQLTDTLVAEKTRLRDHLCKDTQRSIKRIIKQLEAEIKRIDEKMRKLIKEDKEKNSQFERLQTFKGVGEKVAIGLVSGLSELGTLSRGGIAALLGVAPKNHDSGHKVKKRIIVGGRFEVRKLVYMAALSAIRYNQTMKAFYTRLKEKGKPSKVAIAAVMRKIIITLNAMIREGVDYNENKLFSKREA